MLTFKNQQKEQNVTKAPWLSTFNGKAVARFVNDHAQFIRYAQAKNDKKIPEVGLLERIDPATKHQILAYDLPTNIPLLQQFYPASREFGNDIQTTEEISVQAERIASALVQKLVGSLTEFLKLELKTLSISRDSVDSLENQATLVPSEPSQNHNLRNHRFSPPQSDSSLVIKKHLMELDRTSPHILMLKEDSPLYIYAEKEIEELFWNEELIRLLFKHVMHKVVDDGQVEVKELIKDIKVNWEDVELDNRISNYSAKILYTLKTHSLLRLTTNQDSLKLLIEDLAMTWPLVVQEKWKSLTLTDGEAYSWDSFFKGMQKLSKRIGVIKNTQMPQRNHTDTALTSNKRNMPAHNEPGPRNSAGGSGRHTSGGDSRNQTDTRTQESKKPRHEVAPPPSYKCLKCQQTKGHWPMDCPDLTAFEKTLTREQWIQMAKNQAKEKQGERFNKYKNGKPSSYSDDLKIFMTRAKESDDHFLSTINHNNKECVVTTILDTGSDENVLTTSAFSLLNISLPEGIDQPSVAI
jgi:hypothetical protein